MSADNSLTKFQSFIPSSAKCERAIRNALKTKNILDMVRPSTAIFTTSDRVIGKFETESRFSIWNHSHIFHSMFFDAREFSAPTQKDHELHWAYHRPLESLDIRGLSAWHARGSITILNCSFLRMLNTQADSRHALFWTLQRSNVAIREASKWVIGIWRYTDAICYHDSDFSHDAAEKLRNSPRTDNARDKGRNIRIR
jgi:hypothetical protein